MAALHAATLEPKNVTLPLFDPGQGKNEVFLPPRGIVFLNIFEERYHLLVQRALASNRRFALKQGSLAIVAKILEHGEKDGITWIKVRHVAIWDIYIYI